ncbi:MAG TPA: TetR/AcrR family transcriptional regulator [Aliidongia sp.]|uniref:TetR/AcrR family transcriptional regulator n=1 Tax=Aliidongia sp. TaxID=1914230 RepID=UPI002DDD65CF|nr:TetR/AcrR family transcriptional regulator [Aliidongia sp.]HEV2674418.1 TetR/AcrR family transcriptional regulator [Aliidongia sp.]
MTLGTRDALLQRAEYLIRTRGYSAFSYADLAESSGIRKASVHHHFPKKEDLAALLVSRYIANFTSTLAAIKRADTQAQARLIAYAQLFLDGFENGMLPLCGALSAERSALPESLRATVCAFFDLHLNWLADVVREGVAAGELTDAIGIDRVALLLLSTLEGGSFVGWALQKTDPVLSAFHDVLATLSTSRQELARP